MADGSPLDHDHDDDSAAARRAARVPTLAAHRAESTQRHDAAKARDDLHASRLDRAEAALASIGDRLGKIEAIAIESRGAMRIGAALAGVVLAGVIALISTTIDSRESVAVHGVEIVRLHEADEASATERRELREAVTRAAASVERLAGAMDRTREDR